MSVGASLMGDGRSLKGRGVNKKEIINVDNIPSTSVSSPLNSNTNIISSSIITESVSTSSSTTSSTQSPTSSLPLSIASSVNSNITSYNDLTSGPYAKHLSSSLSLNGSTTESLDSPPPPMLTHSEPSLSCIYSNLLTAVSHQLQTISNSNIENIRKFNSKSDNAHRLLLTVTGELRFYGETSPVVFLNECREYFETNLGASKFTKVRVQESLSKEYSTNNAIYADTLSHIGSPSEAALLSTFKLPSKETCELLLNVFTETINDIYYIFDMDYFREFVFNPIFENAEDLSIGQRNKNECLLSMVFAVSSLFLKHKNPAQLSHLEIQQPHEYFQASSTLMRFHPNNQDDKLWIAEHHLLTYFYLIACCDKGASWIHLGISIRIAQALGLHSNRLNNQFPDEKYVLHRKKFWRSLFICDRVCSINFGRPLTIGNSPSIKQDADDLKEPYQYQLYKIAVINGLIIEKIYGDDDDEGYIAISDLKELCQELTNWTWNLSSDLKLGWENGKEDSGLGPKDFKKLLIHLFYLFGIINMGRPIFMNMITAPLSGIRNDMVLHITKMTIEASYLAIHLMKSFMQTKPERTENFTLITMSLYSALILGMTILNQRKLSTSDNVYIKALTDAIGYAKGTLVTFGKYDKVSRHWSAVLISLLESLRAPMLDIADIVDIPYSIINIKLYEEESISPSSDELDDDNDASSYGSISETEYIDNEAKYRSLNFQSNLPNVCIQDLIHLIGFDGDNPFMLHDLISATMHKGQSNNVNNPNNLDGHIAKSPQGSPAAHDHLDAFKYDFRQVS
ncbi:fungal-specific transcription factor domain-containing protein [Scheffersomyces amazonensis]|uniref:fungal-specific transcription factor domain-containing protein n=1 Tax=Scheffersomyces amazonensis TaxID=1078765 RepID=UPI00315CF554